MPTSRADNREKVIQAAYYACLAIGTPPTVRAVAAMYKRIAERGVHLESVRAWLSKIDTKKIQAHPKADTPTALKSVEIDTDEPVAGYPHARVVKVNSKDTSDSLRSSAMPLFAESEKPKAATKPPKPPPSVDLGWIAAARSAGIATLDRVLGEMTSAERFALARLAIYEFAYCRKSERNNRSKARGFAKGLSGIALHRLHGTMTGQEYMDAAKVVWEAGGRTPMYDAWAALAGIDYEQPQEARQ